jgi:pimeloyl-ACP methyl ester carboxylesterase
MAGFLILPVLLALRVAHAGEPRTTSFPSEDGLTVTADLYLASDDARAPFIVLFHQAGASRGEYREIAPRLNALGFNCMAVDQRSGKGMQGVANETARQARKRKRSTTYLDALPDMRAALRHARGVLVAWGSSYSAALVLRIAADHPELADAVLAVSPGEYFGRLGEPPTWIREAAAQIEQPVFITSARDEQRTWAAIFAAIPSPAKTSYVPATPGNHGARALWKRFADSQGYWSAVSAFLQAVAPGAGPHQPSP